MFGRKGDSSFQYKMTRSYTIVGALCFKLLQGGEMDRHRVVKWQCGEMAVWWNRQGGEIGRVVKWHGGELAGGELAGGEIAGGEMAGGQLGGTRKYIA